MPRSASRSLSQLEQVYVEDRAAWRRWLAAQHATSPGIWLVFDKKASRADRLAYGDAVEEALCYGWIDSLVRRIDDTQYVQLFTPRKPKSTWSRVNKERIARLVEQGLMAEAGLAAIERAKANGTWTTLDAVEAYVMPDDLAAALRRTRGAEAGFASFSPSNRKVYLYWVNQAVRPETRARRVAEVARRSAANVRNRHIQTGDAPKGKSASPRKTASKAGSAGSTKRSAASKKAAKAVGKRSTTRGGGAKRPTLRTVSSKPRAR
ncbi:MAG TPA: YdeI/OmpD-associated family protein [Gemmatimonadaceae bacterium]|nr:YdeI/OmpD-associated family protein [Gemmatimonadaceae bacterium]